MHDDTDRTWLDDARLRRADAARFVGRSGYLILRCGDSRLRDACESNAPCRSLRKGTEGAPRAECDACDTHDIRNDADSPSAQG
jgi:hypothetical protein